MTDGTEAATPRRRGTIVVDSSALFWLDALVPPGKQTQANSDGVPRYVDVLRVLARHGYEVVIPEMVALECAATLAGGLRTQSLFDTWNKDSVCKDLIYEAAIGSLDGIRVQRHDSPSPASQYCHSTRTILGNKGLDKAARRKTMAQRNTNYTITKQGFGEAQAFEIMESLSDAVPVFFLTEDLKSLSTVPRALHGRMNLLNVKGMMHVLEDERLLPALGLQDGLDDHLRVMNDDNPVTSLSHAFSPRRWPDIDEQLRGSTGGKPFRDSLAGLAGEIENLERRTEPTGRGRTGPSQVDKFMKKWQGRDKGSPGRDLP